MLGLPIADISVAGFAISDIFLVAAIPMRIPFSRGKFAGFADLCTDVDLTVNRVGRDRSGWDFVVQQDAVAAAHIPLDARPALWTSFVQVKALLPRQTVIRLTHCLIVLSTAEEPTRTG